MWFFVEESVVKGFINAVVIVHASSFLAATKVSLSNYYSFYLILVLL